MRFAARKGIVGLRQGVMILSLLAMSAGAASAQMIFDGNVLFNNNASGTLAGQFVGTTSTGPLGVGVTPSQLILGAYTHNRYQDPLLPTASYQAGVRPNFQPALGSPAYNSALTVPNDGFFTQTCYAGAIGPDPGDDWTQGWTYWDSTGANRQDLHLANMPNPRPTALYDNVGIFGNAHFSPDSNYLVRGQLRIKSQGSLTIPPGCVVFEEFATLGTIIAERGGKLYAIGTACDPIIITSDDAPGSFTRGHCGGFVINGYAKTNIVNSCAGDSVASEGGAIGYYGGNNDADDSGTLRYVRIEFAGKEITPNNELNSFTWNACGSKTHGDYLQAYQGADDSFEWFGGDMSQKYLVGIDGTDDGYDWQLGTRNRAQFVIVRPSSRFAPSGTQNGDKGIEADDNEFNFDEVQCAGRSNCTLANFTIIGEKRVGPTFPGPTSGVNFRRGTAGTFINSIVYNMKTAALKIDDNATLQAHFANPPIAPTVFCGNFAAVSPITSGSVLVARSLPNPFRNAVNFSFSLPQDGDVSVQIFGADGRLVDTVAEGRMAAGNHNLTWKLEKETPSGVYFYRVMSNGASATGKITRVD